MSHSAVVSENIPLCRFCGKSSRSPKAPNRLRYVPKVSEDVLAVFDVAYATSNECCSGCERAVGRAVKPAKAPRRSASAPKARPASASVPPAANEDAEASCAPDRPDSVEGSFGPKSAKSIMEKAKANAWASKVSGAKATTTRLIPAMLKPKAGEDNAAGVKRVVCFTASHAAKAV